MRFILPILALLLVVGCVGPQPPEQPPAEQPPAVEPELPSEGLEVGDIGAGTELAAEEQFGSGLDNESLF